MLCYIFLVRARRKKRGPSTGEVNVEVCLCSRALTLAVVARPPVAILAFALVGARRVVAGGEASAVAPS